MRHECGKVETRKPSSRGQVAWYIDKFRSYIKSSVVLAGRQTGVVQRILFRPFHVQAISQA